MQNDQRNLAWTTGKNSKYHTVPSGECPMVEWRGCWLCYLEVGGLIPDAGNLKNCYLDIIGRHSILLTQRLTTVHHTMTHSTWISSLIITQWMLLIVQWTVNGQGKGEEVCENPWTYVQIAIFQIASVGDQTRAIWPIWPSFEVNGLDWQCCLAGSSKMAPRIFIFLIVLGAKYSSYVKSIASFALTFFGYIISVLAIVQWQHIP